MKKPLLYAVLSSLLLSSCQKFLDAKPDQSQVVPSSLSDFQAMLDDNRYNLYQSPNAVEVCSDDVWVNATDWAAADLGNRSAYTWGADIFATFNQDGDDWTNVYRNILNYNVALEGLPNVQITAGQQADRDNAIGTALFLRSWAFYSLAQEFCGPYDPKGPNTGLGICLRLSSDINQRSVRATISDTYNQIIRDASASVPLLAKTPLYYTRPGKSAAYAFLSRIYLSMENYDKAKVYADSSLQLSATLVDYNTLNASATFPIPLPNSELLYVAAHSFGLDLAPVGAKVDSLLYKQYLTYDLRKTVFFKPTSDGFAFYGTYISDGSYSLFSGLAVDEVLLIRAECLARQGNASGAMTDLNTLLVKRYKAGTFVQMTASSADDALVKVLAERRKELLFRTTRWSDLRRLNRDSRFAKTLIRNINGTIYTLNPNDPAYVLPIPPKVIALSGIPQNPR